MHVLYFPDFAFLQISCISPGIQMSNSIFLFLKVYFMLLYNDLGFLFVIFPLIPWKVWQEECAVCNHGNADRLQLCPGLLYQLGDVFSVLFAGRHGTDI